MADNKNISLAKVGYLYHYPQLAHPSEKFRLDIYLSQTPQDQFFGIRQAHFYIKQKELGIGRLTVTHPWDFDNQAQVCPGLVILEDHRKNKEEAFTFGGNLKINDQDSHTNCSLVSNAPILEITMADPLRKLLVEEVEILLSERSATYSDHNAYESHLCSADPLELYQACLVALIDKFDQFPHKSDQYVQFLSYLHAQQHRLEAAGLTGYPTPEIAKIL